MYSYDPTTRRVGVKDVLKGGGFRDWISHVTRSPLGVNLRLGRFEGDRSRLVESEKGEKSA